MEVSAMIGRQLPFFSVLVPFWLIWAFAGRGMMEIWPAILVAGLSFAMPQYLVSNFIGPELVDIIAAWFPWCLTLFLRVWQPKKIWTSASLKGHEKDGGEPPRPSHGRLQRQGAAARLDALDHPDGVRLHLGPAAGQGLAQPPVPGQVPDDGPAQSDREGAAGGRQPAKESPSTR
jgi:hypothetical protein